MVTMNLADFSNIVELLLYRAGVEPDTRAYTYLQADGQVGLTLTYGELDRQARAIAVRLQQLAAPGERAIMLYGPGLEAVPAFFGCQYAGLIAVPIIPPRPNQSPAVFLNILLDAGATLILTSQRVYDLAQAQYGSTAFFEAMRWVVTDTTARTGSPEAWVAVKAQPRDPCMLLYTSGSTSAPKGVVVTHANVLGHARALLLLSEPFPGETIVTWAPLFHAAGLIGAVLQPLTLQFQMVALSPLDVIEHPARWLQAVSRYQAAFSGSATFAYQMAVDRITPSEREGLDLSAWRYAFVGSEPIRADVLDRFARTYAPYGFNPAAFYPAYGLSEATLLVTGRAKGRTASFRHFDGAALKQGRVAPVEAGRAGAHTLVGCGHALPEEKIRIIDTDTLAPCEPDRIGEVWVSSARVAVGYWNKPEATEATFRGFVAGTGEGPFLRTGDLGFLFEDDLYIAGRLKEMIIVYGRNYYAQDIEAAAAGSHPHLGSAAAAFAVTRAGAEQIVIYHELKPDLDAPDIEAISQAVRQAVAQTLELPLHAVVLVEAGGLPRTPTGKLQRYQCREQFLDAQGQAG